MSRSFIRRLMLVPAALVVLALLGWLLLPLFVSTDFVRGAIERQITELAGQRVSIGSTSDIGLLPTPSARLKNVIIRTNASAHDAGEEDIVARIGAIDVEMSLGSVITGNPRFSSIHLIEPNIRLVRSEDRDLLSQLPAQNIVAAVRIASQQREEQRANNTDTVATEIADMSITYPDWLDMRVGTITFENGSVALFDNGAAQADMLFEELEGSMVWPRIDQPMTLSGSASYRGETVALSYATQNPVEALAGEIADARLEATSELGSLEFVGNAGVAAGFYAFGDITFQAASLRNLLRWRGDDVRPAIGLGAVDLSASMQARGRTIRLDDLQIDIDGNTGSGVIEFADDGENPLTLIGTLDFDTLELRDFFNAFVTLPSSRNSRRSIDTRFMDQLQTDLRISAAQASFGDLTMQNVAATAQTTQDIALFDIGDSEAFGGTLSARLRLVRNSEAPMSELSITGNDVELQTIKQALTLPSIVPDGTANFTLDLSAALGDWRSLLSTPDGQLSLRMNEGQIAGFSPAALDTIYAAGGFSQLEINNGATANFQSLIWETDINQGALSLDDFVIDYGAGSLDFSGVFQMDNQSVALTLIQGLPPESGPQPARRFFIGGGIDQPYVYPVISTPPQTQGQ